MDIHLIVAVGGQPGLFRAVAQIKNGMIAESLTDKKRIPVYNSTKVNTLAEVGIYTTGEERPLKEVFQSIYDKEKGGNCIDHKKPDAELKAYFKTILPEYDEEKVYLSDIKKVLNWYNILKNVGLMDKAEPEQSEEDKLKLKAEADKASHSKTKGKDLNSKPLKTAGSKVGTQGVRKTGVA